MGQHLLIIDGDADVRNVYADALGMEGYTVTLWDQVPTDLAAIARLQSAVMVLEYLFDGQPLGRPVLHALTQGGTTRHIPLLRCTVATRTLADALPYVEAAHIGLLRKPFPLEMLLAGIRELLGEPRTDGQTVFVDSSNLHARAVG